MSESLSIKYRDIKSLTPRLTNPRVHADFQIDRVVKSLQEFGFTNPILIEDDGKVIAGHGRLMAAKKMGLSSVPTISLSHLTPEQARAYVIADNQTALTSSWDDELLKQELDALGEVGFDLTVLGWGDLIPDFGEEPDYSALDDLDDPTEELQDGIKKAIQIEFRPEDYEEAQALVAAARKRGVYVGMKLIEALSA